jgi:hypothetical protein
MGIRSTSGSSLAVHFGAIGKIESTFKKVIPSMPFEYKFVDQEYAMKFAAEERIGKLATFFGSLAIFISCLGLFGLSSFVAEQRTKEIGYAKYLALPSQIFGRCSQRILSYWYCSRVLSLVLSRIISQ